MTHPGLREERGSGGLRRLLLANPRRHNPLTPGLARALRDAFAADPAAPVVLGSTDPAVFCAGADMTIGEAERAQVSALLYECLEVMITRPGPVIAAVGGPAVAGGAQLATAADLRIAGPAARFRWIGPPGRDLAVGAWVLPDLVGRGRAAELAAGSAGSLARIKMITATGGLLDRLHAERRANQEAWAKALAAPPLPP